MHVETRTAHPLEVETDLLVLPLTPAPPLFDLGEDPLAARVDGIGEALSRGDLQGEQLFEARHLPNLGAILVDSTSSEKGLSLWEGLKTLSARAVGLAARTGRRKVSFALNTEQGEAMASRLVEGAMLGTYSFQRYKRDPRDRFSGLTLDLLVPEGTEQGPSRGTLEEIEQARRTAAAVNFARDLILEPADALTPQALAEQALELSSQGGFEVEIWDEERLRAEGFTGLLKVGGGAQNPPRMIRITATPPEVEGSAPHLVLLGKAVTFDTGGISLKPAADMHLMKGDMSGGAAVLGVMKALATEPPPLKVTAILVCAENSPGSKAQRPGDVIRYRNGLSVEVENTDAEGRLLLADGLILAGALGATHIVDIATLTGACARALGPSFTGLMGNQRELINALTRAGGSQGEACWKLPLPEEYRELLKTPVADLKNVGGPEAGALTAGLFLQAFVPEQTAWAHMDIAGPFWRKRTWKYFQPGPTGVGVRTLLALIRGWSPSSPNP